jgi:hypothetical protein
MRAGFMRIISNTQYHAAVVPLFGYVKEMIKKERIIDYMRSKQDKTL